MRIASLIVTCFIGATLSSPIDEIEPKQSTPNYRLPTNVMPSNYVIEIEPYFTGTNEFTFSGRAAITLRSQTTTNEIVLHQNDLTIDELLTTLTLAANTASQTIITGTSWDNVTHLYTLHTATTLVPNVDYRLTFVYTGILSSDMRGFYRSSYVENGVTK